MKITLSTGNKKLTANDNVKFLIWNIPAQITCPFATEHCKEKCYAKKAERLYPQVLPCRMANLESSKSAEFVDNMKNAIAHYISKRTWKDKTVYFRIHESGDFYSQAYYDKWVDIATAFPGVLFLAYTKSLKFVLNSKKTRPTNLIIRYSLWDDSPAEDAEKGCAMFPTYTAEKLTGEKVRALGERYCDCKDCGTCGKCYNTEVKDIVCNIH